VFQKVLLLIVVGLGLLVGCAPTTASTGASQPSAASPTTVASPARSAAPTPIAPPSATAATASTPATTGAAGSTPSASASTTAANDVMRFDVAPDGTEARFRVREQLADRSFPSDAIGKTNALTGGISVGPDGKIVSDQSKFVVDLKTLQSDSAKRDGFIQRSTMNTARYPTAEFVPTELRGAPSPLPQSGKVTFQLAGNLTAHGVTHPIVWDVTANVDGKDLTGLATTSFKFEDFGMEQPRVAVLLSVEDNVKLEVDFHLVRSA